MREQLGKQREREIAGRDGGVGDGVAIEGESFFGLGIEEEGLDDGVGDECIGVWEEGEEGGSEVRGG